MKTEYIYICAQAYCNDQGSGIEYYTDYERFDNRNDAIKNGWEQRESDDFNIGVLVNGRLVSVDWMTKPIDTDPETLRKIEDKLELY
ncbi:antitoxin [Morganella morganii]|nr:antitoxin [Morganella morganii]EKW3937928.1 antitoxin [Morganella morganii]